MAEKEIVVFARSKSSVKSVEGLEVMPDKSIDELVIGAISIAPIMLVRIGMLKGKPFMAGVNKDEVMEESFSEFELEKMIGWDDNLANPIKEGYLITDKILTLVSYNFVK